MKGAWETTASWATGGGWASAQVRMTAYMPGADTQRACAKCSRGEQSGGCWRCAGERGRGGCSTAGMMCAVCGQQNCISMASALVQRIVGVYTCREYRARKGLVQTFKARSHCRMDCLVFSRGSMVQLRFTDEGVLTFLRVYVVKGAVVVHKNPSRGRYHI